MLADLEKEQDTAAFRWGLMISNSRMTVLQCSPSRRLQPSSAESLPLGSFIGSTADWEDEPYTAAFRGGPMISDLLKMVIQIKRNVPVMV